MVLGIEIIILVILLLLSGFFSGSEVALISLTRVKARYMLDKKKFGAVFVKNLKDDPQRMLATILIGNNLVNVAAAAMATSIMIEIFKIYAIAIATGVMTLLILIFGEITPKSIAAKNNELISQLVAAPIWYLSIILAPILNILDKFLNRFIKLMGIKTQEKAITEEEIMSMIKLAEEEGSIKEIEEKMIKSILEFDDISVGEIATPRKDMIMLESKLKIKNAFKIFLKKRHTRMPVYEKYREHIIGIVHITDLMKNMQGKNKNDAIRKIMYKPYFVPEVKKISDLLRRFQKRKEHMAIVVDEHGSITGLVTLEDVLEEIVGEIMDETDIIAPNTKKIGKNIWIVNGKIDIEEVNEKLNMKLKGKGYDTLSGFILEFTGKIPKEGDEISYNKFKLKIEEIEDHRISKVRVEKK
jgi:CBS domain containing-hemolysin-like protein|tara:strand:- start:34591 stop:35829 length:1239 start_codon:yes stop_codon:yes gene_type:complete